MVKNRNKTEKIAVKTCLNRVFVVIIILLFENGCKHKIICGLPKALFEKKWGLSTALTGVSLRFAYPGIKHTYLKGGEYEVEEQEMDGQRLSVLAPENQEAN